jgi:hypothetical protein
MNPAHTFPHYCHEIISNIIFPSTPTSSEWSLPFFIPITFIIGGYINSYQENLIEIIFLKKYLVTTHGLTLADDVGLYKFQRPHWRIVYFKMEYNFPLLLSSMLNYAALAVVKQQNL